MLGHCLFQHLRDRHEVRVTLRRSLASYGEFKLFDAGSSYPEIDVRDPDRLIEVIAEFAPVALVNCAGIVKQRSDAKAHVPSLEINSLFPHRLASMARLGGARLIHLSTDCVFSGSGGNYRETDASDATDLYGRSKFLGEVTEAPCLTLRTGMLGPELGRKTGLLEWFIAQRGKSIKGFRRAIFTGFTTMETSRIVERLLVDNPTVAGLYHVSSAPISKYDLLRKINEALGLDIQIAPDEDFHCDRSLDSSQFRKAFAYVPPTWDEMVAELAKVVH